MSRAGGKTELELPEALLTLRPCYGVTVAVLIGIGVITPSSK